MIRQTLIANDPDRNEVIALIRSGYFNQFRAWSVPADLAAIESPGDPWLTAADFASFVAAQQRVAETYPGYGALDPDEHSEQCGQRAIFHRSYDSGL